MARHRIFVRLESIDDDGNVIEEIRRSTQVVDGPVSTFGGKDGGDFVLVALGKEPEDQMLLEDWARRASNLVRSMRQP